MAVIARNPILSGFYPDPSICAAGEDFYLVNSSFAYFPGLPVFHSRDLAHWEQIGNVMERESQLPLKGAKHSGGLFAPTIRYHEGTFYVICTNVTHGGNFIVTAHNPAGPWSEPEYLEGADGIDPSLFFDEDGRCYYIGTHPNPEGCQYDGDWYIWIQELDLKRMRLVGEVHNVWNGAMRGVHWPEGPHLYKKGEYYYILHAEGGTGPEHAVSVCRGRKIFGPYENNFCNPVFTHRHLGSAYPIQYVGHADLVETSRGDWYMVMLAVRPLEGYTTLGRETFLAKVIWEKEWPVVNPGVGMLTDTVEINLPEWVPAEKQNMPEKYYDFTGLERLGAEFLTVRNPEKDLFVLTKEGLQLKFGQYTLKERENSSYLALRQENHFFEVAVVLSTGNLSEKKKAGITLMQSNEYHLRAEVSGNVAEKERVKIEVFLCRKGQDELICCREICPAEEEISLYLRVKGLTAEMFWENVQSREGELLFNELDIRSLSTEVAGGFVGCTVGMYAVEDGADHCGTAQTESSTETGDAVQGEESAGIENSDKYALFISFRYQELSEVFWEREGEYR